MSPYTDAQLRAIDALGKRVDADLLALDVRLTQGGEPTFVATADATAPEWNYTADSPAKRRLAARLLRTLRARFAPRGLMLHGQGKWYPGEALPRWAYGLHWRTDGRPLWTDPALIATEDSGAASDTESARRMVEAVATRLGAPRDAILAAHEDPWRAVDIESRTPEGVDPLRGDLTDSAERARLARLLRQGLGTVVAYVLPLRPFGDGAPLSWRSERWRLRRERLYLVPGDSAAGYRLPLDALAESADPIRTALCVELRAGRLHVFLPPLDTLDAYAALLAVVEQCARDLDTALFLEGYEPPPDDGLCVLRVTPDPGVIEVNVQPAADWESLAAITSAVYEEARALGLGAGKFLLDGRPTGTGGGSHITLGGPTVRDSPLLRRPDLLASLIAYWQNHPALSYVFSGQYIGPTSQAPRVDEAREDSLYELEIAFEELARLQRSGTPAPEEVDRLLHNLLVDVAGNTHRAEFCVDKLASPDGPAGRLGLLELRAFEMAPHEHMALVQALLVRALVAWFWRAPYRSPLRRWGPALRDRYLLPHYLGADLREVLAHLGAAGYPIDYAWFAAFLEFRFPACGSTNWSGTRLELRHALEPWPVLGDAKASVGAARAVDASLDRLQVSVTGLDPVRHAVLCNGRRVPLRDGGAGAYVAGVRYRARLFPSMLHPSLGVHTPLVFDLLDLDTGRSLGRCAYHSTDPAGSPYTAPPANAEDAQARRAARFVLLAPPQHRLSVAMETPHPGAPCTLDLRRQPRSPAEDSP